MNKISYKMVALYIVLFSANSLTTAVVASFLNTEWATLTPTKKFLLIMVILQSWTGVLLAFFNKSLARAEHGEFPIPLPTGDTGLWTKQAGAVTPLPGTPTVPPETPKT